MNIVVSIATAMSDGSAHAAGTTSRCRVSWREYFLCVLGVLILLPTAVPAQLNQTWTPCRDPLRLFSNNETVNLLPLFQWWGRQPVPHYGPGGQVTNNVALVADLSDRPLTAWRRITGSEVATMAGDWVVEAVIYTSPMIHTNGRILLNHPPVAEQQAYNNLLTQLAQADQQITNLMRTYQSDTNAEQRNIQEAEAWRRSNTKVASTGYELYGRRAVEKQSAAQNDLRLQTGLMAAREQIRTQLAAIPVLRGAYHIDVFAMDTGRTNKQGWAIYDMGIVPPRPGGP